MLLLKQPETSNLKPETLSVIIIAYNEARHIGAALASAAAVADELLVVLDPRTTDQTTAVARQHGAQVIEHAFVSFAHQRNTALRLARCDWVLFLDGDERLTPDLANELERWKAQRSNVELTTPNGYWIPRHNLYFGQRLRGGGWYPDRQLRLLRRDHARYDETRPVHEYAAIDGSVSELHGHLIHINIETWPELHRKQRRYAILEAQTLAQAGTRAKWRNLIGQPLREINRRFVRWHGYRDGRLGLTLALVMAYYEWVKYVHLKALDLIRENTRMDAKK